MFHDSASSPTEEWSQLMDGIRVACCFHRHDWQSTTIWALVLRLKSNEVARLPRRRFRLRTPLHRKPIAKKDGRTRRAIQTDWNFYGSNPNHLGTAKRGTLSLDGKESFLQWSLDDKKEILRKNLLGQWTLVIFLYVTKGLGVTYDLFFL